MCLFAHGTAATCDVLRPRKCFLLDRHLCIVASSCRMTTRPGQVQVPEPSRRIVPLLQLATAHFRSHRLQPLRLEPGPAGSVYPVLSNVCRGLLLCNMLLGQTYLVRAAILVKMVRGYLFSRVIHGGRGRDREQKGLRTESASAAGRWAFGRAEAMKRMWTTRGGGCAAGVRRDATTGVCP